MSVLEKTPVPKNQETGEEICGGQDTQLRPTIMSLKINKCYRVVLTTLIKANVLLKRLNDQ